MTGAPQRFGLIVIGDELLSGRRTDQHFPKVVNLLAARGLELGWVRFIGDDSDLVERTLRESFVAGDIVFSCGGIGATPDDRTRACAAAALGLYLEPHPDGVRELETRFEAPITSAQRLRLVEFPVGSTIIPNPVNRIPGFAVREHYFVPGFPKMAWPMMEWVLETYYQERSAPGSVDERALRLPGARESDVIALMERFEARFPELKLSCLPMSQGEGFELELGVRGASERVAAGVEALAEASRELGFSPQEVATRKG